MASSKSRSQILMYSLGAVLVTVLFLALSACAAAEKEEVVLRLNLGGEPRSLDPALATDSISIDVAGSLFVGLTEINEVTSAVEPALAEEWEVSRDGTVYTFRLRRDVRWTDGSRVTAQDVAYGILRTLAPETASEYAYVPAAIIKGGGDYNAGDVTNPGIVGVRVVDDFTLEVELEHPAGYFPSIASMWVMWSQPREAIEAHGDQWIEPANIVTNGPYKLETWEHENRIVLVKNPDYYDARNVQIDRIEGAMILEASTEMALYEAGDLDCTCGWGIPFEDIGRVKAHPTLSQEFYSAPRLITYYYGFNVTKAPFDNALVRKAFSAAIDRQGLIDNVLKGGQKVALTFTAPGNFGAVDAQAEGIGIPFDSGRARQYLVDAGYPGGQGLPPITLMYNTSEGHKKIAEAIQAMWREHLGVEVSLANQEFAVYLDTLVSDAPQVWRLGWLADYPDANNWVEVFISTSGNNFGKYNNPEYDQLVADAAREQDPERRLELYKQAERLLAETDAAIAPIYHYTFVTLSKPYLTRTYEPFGNKVFKHWRIER